MPDLRYPIGRFEHVGSVTDEQFNTWVDEIALLPHQLRQVAAPLSDAQLDTPYRPGGWTLRQVVHHLADSHLNGYVRTRWALTEDAPTIKPYDEAAWAASPDYAAPIDYSLDLIGALHARWTALWRSLSSEQRGRTFVHPDDGQRHRLDRHAGTYAWHGRHHLAHLTGTARREGWS
jgi:hypothetical protein